jgi:hypothetical protein
MAIHEINRVVDMVLGFFDEARPLYNTIIHNYFPGRNISLFKGVRKHVADSNVPCIEVGPISDTLKWHSVRVQEDTFSLDIRVTINLSETGQAIDLEGKLVSLTTKILANPPHLRPQIPGYNAWLYDTELPTVSYGSAGAVGTYRISKIEWSGKVLDYLSDQDFEPMLSGNGTWGQ